MLSQAFGISRQAYYQREVRLARHLEEKETILELIKPIRKKMHRFGSVKLYDKIKDDMNKKNIKKGRDKFLDLLREENMLVPRKKNYVKTTDSFHRFHKHKNLVKGLEVTCPEQVWVSDITYIKTDAGHHYLSLITDYYSKKIVGYYLADNMRTESSLIALNMAIKSRQYPERDLIHHSDRGFQYCDNRYIDILTKSNIKPSMTEVYDPYENAVAERVNGILKDEFDIGEGFKNHLQAIKEIKYAIETYNTFRPHLSCCKMTPEQAHNVGKFKMTKWGGRKKFKKKEVNNDNK